MTRTPVLVSWSGGKDCAWALHRLRWSEGFEVVGLLTTLTEGYERVAMHGIRHDVLVAQAEAARLPVIESWIPSKADNATYEAAFGAALAQAESRWPGLRHIAFGDLFLADVRGYRDALLSKLGWTGAYPLWDSDTATLAQEMQSGGLRARLCCVDSQQLDRRFAGRAWDADLLAGLPPGVDPCGENGEFHTLVHAGPMFAHELVLEPGEVVERDGRFIFADFQTGTGRQG